MLELKNKKHNILMNEKEQAQHLLDVYGKWSVNPKECALECVRKLLLYNATSPRPSDTPWNHTLYWSQVEYLIQHHSKDGVITA